MLVLVQRIVEVAGMVEECTQLLVGCILRIVVVAVVAVDTVAEVVVGIVFASLAAVEGTALAVAAGMALAEALASASLVVVEDMASESAVALAFASFVVA